MTMSALGAAKALLSTLALNASNARAASSIESGVPSFISAAIQWGRWREH